MEICILSSGSRANALFIRSGGFSVLLDCGLSAKEATRRLALIGVVVSEIGAIIITHEHNDHVAGVPVFAKHAKCLVYATARTFGASRHLADVPESARVAFSARHPFSVGTLTFDPMAVDHDAVEPVAFRVTDGSYSVACFTDLGFVRPEHVDRLDGLDALILEANHDRLLLEECPYPWELKQRIKGSSGHLSNEQAAELLTTLCGRANHRLRYVIAAHISEKSNDPSLALDALERAWSGDRSSSVTGPRFLAAGAREATPLIALSEPVSRAMFGSDCASVRAKGDPYRPWSEIANLEDIPF